MQRPVTWCSGETAGKCYSFCYTSGRLQETGPHVVVARLREVQGPLFRRCLPSGKVAPQAVRSSKLLNGAIRRGSNCASRAAMAVALDLNHVKFCFLREVVKPEVKQQIDRLSGIDSVGIATDPSVRPSIQDGDIYDGVDSMAAEFTNVRHSRLGLGR